MADTADLIIVGAGLAGLTAAYEACARGLTVTLIDQESPQNLGGQAYWSFGGLFLVNSPEQRRWGIRDSFDLAWSDWQYSAGWDRFDDGQDTWATRWAKAYVEWAAGEKRSYITQLGIKLTPVVGWAERGNLFDKGHGNSVPRFHIPWGTGCGVVEPFTDWVHTNPSRLTLKYRHRLTRILTTDGRVTGVAGDILAPDTAPRGQASTRDTVGEFELHAPNVLIATGGIGGNHDLVRRWWPTERLGTPPATMITGVPACVDGSGLDAAEAAGARLVNRDRMWHYTEGVTNWDPIWPGHAIRILPGPSPLWLDALGNRLPNPALPGHDTLATLKYLRTGPAKNYDHSWFIVSEKIAAKEFALSGSEQNPDITGRDKKLLLKTRLGRGLPGPVANFVKHSPEWVRAQTVPELVDRMNAITPEVSLDVDTVQEAVAARDRAITAPFSKDAQAMSIRNSRSYLGDRLARTTRPHALTDPRAGGLIAIKLWVLTRKSSGGIQTDLSGRALDAVGQPIEGLWAAGEAAGFGGGGVHGYNALEGTFLGGCLFSGRQVGRSVGA